MVNLFLYREKAKFKTFSYLPLPWKNPGKIPEYSRNISNSFFGNLSEPCYSTNKVPREEA